MGTLSLDAEALYAELLSGVRSLLQPDSALVGIWSGGAWLAERLQVDLNRKGPCGVISSARSARSTNGRSASDGITPRMKPVTAAISACRARMR